MYSVHSQLYSSLQSGFLVERFHQVLLNSNEGETTERIRFLSPLLLPVSSRLFCSRNFSSPLVRNANNRPFSSCFKSHYESEASCTVFIMNISFHSYANKTIFHMKTLHLTFVMRLKATWKYGQFSLRLSHQLRAWNWLLVTQCTVCGFRRHFKLII